MGIPEYLTVDSQIRCDNATSGEPSATSSTTYTHPPTPPPPPHPGGDAAASA